MNYHQYYPIDVVNGPGTRCTLFVAGCIHQCRGCYNQSTWRVDSGVEFTQLMEDRIIQDLQDTRIPRRGLSLLRKDKATEMKNRYLTYSWIAIVGITLLLAYLKHL